MTMTATPVYAQTLTGIGKVFTNATSTTATSVFAATTNGTRIDSLNISSTDTASHDIQIILYDGSTQYLVGTVSVPAGAGNTSGVASVAVLPLLNVCPLDSMGNHVLILQTGWSLYAAAVVAITSGKQVVFTGCAAAF